MLETPTEIYNYHTNFFHLNHFARGQIDTPGFKVLIDWIDRLLAIMCVCELPPRLSFNRYVSIESLYGMNNLDSVFVSAVDSAVLLLNVVFKPVVLMFKFDTEKAR